MRLLRKCRATPHQQLFLILKRKGIRSNIKMTYAIQPCHYTILIRLSNRPAFDKSGLSGNMGNITKQIRKTRLFWKIPGIFCQVEKIG
ncbi:hypothetical protein NEIFLAOT_02467 [Neisseria flavescens NRL30031/H210]|uniref:Uncharacterized protein n=1 Tax=Neisseria flavescens NRL30031/H210 TaxID=546264 RepID=C0ER67_NEIFL|nr:hypothetical protein NEIFLAOT_02467 [Neisseria flavescens NRL30031/H210]